MVISRIRTEDEFEQVLATLVVSFATDPIARWMHGGSTAAHLRDFPRIMRALARDCADAGTVSRTDNGEGVALWLPPDARTDEDEMGRSFGEAVPAGLQEEVGRLFDWTDEQRPSGRFWYLSLIGVDPVMQGRGLGSALIEDGLRRADADGLPTYLWSSNPRNLGLYERHGFETLAVARFGPALPVTAMVRPAGRPDRPILGA